MIKAVLFDLDNTLIDFMGLKKKSCSASVDAMINAGLKIDRKNATKILFGLYKKYGIEHGRIFQKFLLRTTGKIDMKILSAGIVAYRRVQAQYRRPYKNVKTVMKKLKRRYKLGIISDAPSIKAWVRLTELDIVDYFDVVVAYDDTRKKKPHALPFKAAIKKLGIAPKNILFVGDHPIRDVEGAKNVGMKTALALYGIQKAYEKHASKSKPDFILKDINDILKIV